MDDKIPMKHVLPRELLREIAMNLPPNQCAKLYSLPISNVFDSYIVCLHRSYVQKKVHDNHQFIINPPKNDMNPENNVTLG